MTSQDIIDKAAQIISGNIYGPSAAIETCRLIAQALADAGLLATDPRDITAVVERNLAVAKVDEYRQRLDQARAERGAAVAKLDQIRELADEHRLSAFISAPLYRILDDTEAEHWRDS